MQEIVFHRLAGAELREAVAWYAARSEQTSRRFGKSVRDAVERIGSAPHLHAVIAGPYRCVRVRRFPYVLIFEVRRQGGMILIVAVAHTSRRPGYWRRRK